MADSTADEKLADHNLSEKQISNRNDEGQQTFVEEQEVRSPIGMMAWLGFGCTLFALAALCISFASPFWFQTWPQSFNTFQSIGLWEACFDNFIHPKDDTMHLYSGCYWVFSSDPNIRKLREWLTPPWMITCQILVVGILLILVITVAIVAVTFYHMCPVINHQYHETYAMFAAASLMFLDTVITIIVAGLFGSQCQDRNWLPRPDLNLLSWGFGFLIVNGLVSIPAGAFYFMEAKSVYDELLDREEEYIEKYEEAIMQNAENTAMAMGYDPSIVPPGALGNSFATQASFGGQMSYYDATGQMGYPPDVAGTGYAGVAYPAYGAWAPAPAYTMPPGGYYASNTTPAPEEPYKISDLPDEQVPDYVPQKGADGRDGGGGNYGNGYGYYPTTEQGYRMPPDY